MIHAIIHIESANEEDYRKNWKIYSRKQAHSNSK